MIAALILMLGVTPRPHPSWVLVAKPNVPTGVVEGFTITLKNLQSKRAVAGQLLWNSSYWAEIKPEQHVYEISDMPLSNGYFVPVKPGGKQTDYVSMSQVIGQPKPGTRYTVGFVYSDHELNNASKSSHWSRKSTVGKLWSENFHVLSTKSGSRLVR